MGEPVSSTMQTQTTTAGLGSTKSAPSDASDALAPSAQTACTQTDHTVEPPPPQLTQVPSQEERLEKVAVHVSESSLLYQFVAEHSPLIDFFQSFEGTLSPHIRGTHGMWELVHGPSLCVDGKSHLGLVIGTFIGSRHDCVKLLAFLRTQHKMEVEMHDPQRHRWLKIDPGASHQYISMHGYSDGKARSITRVDCAWFWACKKITRYTNEKGTFKWI